MKKLYTIFFSVILLLGTSCNGLYHFSSNGVEYDRRTVHKVSLKGEKDIKLPPVMKKALYKVVDMYPDADYFMPVYVKSEQQKMFGGKYVSRKALIRAYKFR